MSSHNNEHTSIHVGQIEIHPDANIRRPDMDAPSGAYPQSGAFPRRAYALSISSVR